MNNNDEQPIWTASQSQASNCFIYTLMALSLFIVLAVALWISNLGGLDNHSIHAVTIAMLLFLSFSFLKTYLVTKNTKYTLTSQRLQTHTGVFSKETDDLELYRVIDTRLEKPFILRLFGLGNIILITADSTSPILPIVAIREASHIRDNIRHLVEKAREAKKVREFI